MVSSEAVTSHAPSAVTYQAEKDFSFCVSVEDSATDVPGGSVIHLRHDFKSTKKRLAQGGRVWKHQTGNDALLFKSRIETRRKLRF